MKAFNKIMMVMELFSNIVRENGAKKGIRSRVNAGANAIQ